MYTQGVCVLVDAAPSLSVVAGALSDFRVMRETAPSEEPQSWAFAGPSVIVDYRSDVNGVVQVDIVNQHWPDAMGEPSGAAATIFGAWSMGHFGPCTFPGALERGLQHAYAWPGAREVAPRHTAFLRVRSSYVFGASGSFPIQPADYDPIDELRFVSEVQLALAGLPGFLAMFNPNGELLLPAERVEECIHRDARGEALAVDAWANVRMFRPSRDGEAWMLYDTVGMGQLDVCDHQATLPRDHESTPHVPGLLYSIAEYDAQNRGVMGPDDTATDSGGCLWRAHEGGDALVVPPRRAVYWSPSNVRVPSDLRATNRE